MWALRIAIVYCTEKNIIILSNFMAQFIRALAQGLCLDLVLFDKLRFESVINLVIPIKFLQNKRNI